MKNTSKGNDHAGREETMHSNEKKSAETKRPGKAKDLQGLFEAQLKDIYWAEKALLKAIPKMADKCTSDELTAALEDHLEETKGHVKRLETIFEKLGERPEARKCEAMEGLIAEGERIMEETERGPVGDAGVIFAAQKVEHYEIATYGTLHAFASTLGQEEVAGLLEDTLGEEKSANDTLTNIATSDVNIQAEHSMSH